MKYEVELPDEVDRRLLRRASASGQEAVHLIQIAVAQFVNDAGRPGPSAMIRPDPPLDSVEGPPPVDLPLSGQMRPVEPACAGHSHLRPDPPLVTE